MRPLSLEELEACATGCAHVERCGDGFRFCRFHPAAMEFYGRDQSPAIRSRCPAGVVLDFSTDAEAVFVSALLETGARKCGAFDLWTSKRFSGTLGGREAPERLEGWLPCARPKREQRLRLYLPHARPILLSAVALPDGASFAPSARPPGWLFLGDSITQGMDAVHPSLTYPAVAARELGTWAFNYGIGGAKFNAESLPQAPMPAPCGVVIAYGTNDWGNGLSGTAARVYLARVRELYPSAPIYLLLPLWRQDADVEPFKHNAAGQTMEQYRQELRAIGAEFPSVRVVEPGELLPPSPSLLIDGLHPDTAGHLVYGTNLARILQPA